MAFSLLAFPVIGAPGVALPLVDDAVALLRHFVARALNDVLELQAGGRLCEVRVGLEPEGQARRFFLMGGGTPSKSWGGSGHPYLDMCDGPPEDRQQEMATACQDGP